MALKHRNIDITTEPALYFIVAAAFFVIPWRWVAGWLTASVVHELFHFFAIKICRSPIWQIRIGPKGVLMVTDALPPYQEAFCAVAGPIGSGSCLLLSGIFPEASICGFLQGIYNWLPVYPLDGGRCIKALLELFVGAKKACTVVFVLRYFVLIALFCVASYVAVRFTAGILPLLVVGVIFLKTKKSLH